MYLPAREKLLERINKRLNPNFSFRSFWSFFQAVKKTQNVRPASVSIVWVCMYEKVATVTVSIEETVSLGQGERGPDRDTYFSQSWRSYYLSTRPVIRKGVATTKCRIVGNA